MTQQRPFPWHTIAKINEVIQNELKETHPLDYDYAHRLEVMNIFESHEYPEINDHLDEVAKKLYTHRYLCKPAYQVRDLMKLHALFEKHNGELSEELFKELYWNFEFFGIEVSNSRDGSWYARIRLGLHEALAYERVLTRYSSKAFRLWIEEVNQLRLVNIPFKEVKDNEALRKQLHDRLKELTPYTNDDIKSIGITANDRDIVWLHDVDGHYYLIVDKSKVYFPKVWERKGPIYKFESYY